MAQPCQCQQIDDHIHAFNEQYKELSPNLDLEFPLRDIDNFSWNRGDGNDPYYAYLYREFSQNILKRLQAGDNQSILIIGCGFGFDEKNLHHLYKNLTLVSLDVSREMVTRARQSGSPSSFFLCMAEHLPFEDNSFDRVLSREVIEHVMSPELMMEEVQRVLKPAGIAVITTPNADALTPSYVYNQLLAKTSKCPLHSYKDEPPSRDAMYVFAHRAGLILDEVFYDGPLYHLLPELNSARHKDITRIAKRVSPLAGNSMVSRIFCDQVKFVLRKATGKNYPASGTHERKTGEITDEPGPGGRNNPDIPGTSRQNTVPVRIELLLLEKIYPYLFLVFAVIISYFLIVKRAVIYKKPKYEPLPGYNG